MGDGMSQTVKELAAAGRCEGNCEQHSPIVRLVAVDGWGEFAYCDSAITEDQRRGLTVTILESQ